MKNANPGLFFAAFFAWWLSICAFSGPVLGAEKQILDLKYARGFQVEDFSGGKLVTIRPAWREDASGYKYLLVPRGKDVAETHPAIQTITVPVQRVAALSTTHLAYIDVAEKTESLVALSGFKHVNTPSVRLLIDQGKLAEVGHSSRLSIETLMDLSPDLILTAGSGSIHDIHPKLLEAELPAVLIVDHLENNALARCEWIKLMALFFGTEGHAEKLFGEIERSYKRLTEMTAGLQKRPTVIRGAPFRGQWWVGRADSFVAALIRDAGGEHLWPDIPGVGSVPMDVEAVYERALKADFWLDPVGWTTLDQAASADPRLADIQALAKGRVYNNNKRLNRWGGNDYWESGMLRPDVILEDMISMLHPDLLPDRELVYYRHLRWSDGK